MAFCGEIDHIIGFFNKFVYDSLIPYIALYESVVVLVLNVFEVFKVSAIGQRIQIDNMIIRIFFNHISNKIASDKSCSTCNQNICHYNHSYLI